MRTSPYSTQEALNIGLGKRGVINITGTDEYRGTFDIIQFINESVIDALEESNCTNEGSLEMLTIPAGTVLYGTFTLIKLASGAVRAYGVLG